MIRIVLLGRTGNHLFQYALGRMLAEKHGVPLVMDASWFNRAGWEEVSHFLKLPLRAKVIRRCSLASRALRNYGGRHFWEFRGVPFLREAPEDQSFDARFLDTPADCVLFGYFQSPRYFGVRAEVLRAELNGLLSGGVAVPERWRMALAAPGAVAVHVRRTDYLVHSAFQVCDLSYYRTAMGRLRACLPEPRFYIFSDDPDWCRAEFREADQEVVDTGEAAANPLHDLRLMSLASHHVIANSTYSWWAAWLGEKPGQRVLMPDRWYARDILAPIEEKNPGHWETVATGPCAATSR
jgi:hypothetical protein